MTIQNESKFCACCGVELTRKYYGARLEDQAAFKRRRFCGLSCSNTRKDATKQKKAKSVPSIEKITAEPENLTPLEFLLKVMRDPTQPAGRRDRCAAAALKYCHAKPGEKGGKKGEQAEAAGRAANRFAPAPGPNVFPLKKKDIG